MKKKNTFKYPQNDWEFNLLGVYNYNIKGKLYKLFDFLKKNHNKIEGDIFEAGVYNGYQSISIAIFLKLIGSKKKLYCYDTFTGFPVNFHKYDNVGYFSNLHYEKKISNKHYQQVKDFLKLKRKILKIDNNPKNISSSGNFDSNFKMFKKKIKLLNLNNIIIKKGTFNETMKTHKNNPKKIMCGIIDCDLYNSYKTVLEFIDQRLQKKSIVYLDEYYSLKFPGAKVAIDEYLKSKKNNSFYKLNNYTEGKSFFDRYYLIKQ
tara:strand:- start:227 stop:1009 length:783 start_codon:yes stop_codon:yes gene_type:complete